MYIYLADLIALFQDRPSLVIYQPGMGKFSKQRIAKEKEAHLPTAKSVNESEKKDTWDPHNISRNLDIWTTTESPWSWHRYVSSRIQ